MSIETALTVKIAGAGIGQTVRQVADLQNSLKQLGKDAKDTRATAAALGKAFDLPDDQVQDLADALAQAKNETDKLANSASALDKIFTGFFEGLGRKGVDIAAQSFRQLGQAITDTVGKSSQEFGQFDAALTSFSAKSGIARNELSALEEESIRLAAVTSQTPATVAELGTALLTLGANSEQAVERLEAITKLSDVIGEDPILTGKVVQTALTIYEDFGETTEGVADKINTLINTTAAGSSGGVGEFFQLFQTAAPAAKELGVSLDDLSSAFATARDTGASAEVASTGLKIALLSLAAPTGAAVGAIEDLKLEVFDANGEFIGLQESLTQFANATANVSDQRRVELATQIFGREGAPVILSLLSQVQGRYTETANALAESNGSVADSLEVINQGVERQKELLQGQLAGAYTILGAAIAPVELALTKFASELLTATTEGSAGLGELNAAATRFQEALADNPALLQSIASALAGIADVITSTVASALNALADQIGTLSQEDLRQLADRFVETVQTVAALAVQVGQVALVFGELAANVGGAAVDAFNNLAPALGAVVQFLGAVLAAVTPLTGNTELLSLAMQVLFVRMVAIQGLALGAALKAIAVQLLATGAAATTAAGGVGAFATATAAAAAPLVVLAAALAAVNFIKFTRDLKVANDNLEAYIGGIDVAANTSFSFANKIKNLNEEIEKSGDQVTKKQLDRLEEYKRLSQAQVEDLERQLSEVKAFDPKNEQQAQAQQNLISQLDTSINALNGQITAAEKTLADAAAGVGQETGEAFNEGLKETVADEPQATIEDALKGLGDSTKAALADLSTAAANARAAILEAGGDPAKLAALEAQTLRDRIQNNRDFLRELEALQAGGGLSVEDAARVADQIRGVDGQLASDRVSLAQHTLREKERTEKAAADAAKKAADESQKAAEAAAKAAQKAADDRAKAETDGLKKVRDEEKRLADQRQADQEKAAQREFDDARGGRAEARDAQRRAQDKALQQQLQADDRAHQDQRREADRAFQKQQQSAAQSFQQAQQAAAESFQRRLDAERDRGSREFDVLTSEVERRIQLQQAADEQSRRELREQFAEEDRLLKERRQIEKEVLAQRGQILGQRQEETQLSPLEQARADFEEGLQEKQKAFAEGQQAAAQAFQEQQTAEAEARAEALRLADQQRADERAAAEEARAEARRAADKAFQEEERRIQDQFEGQQRAAKEAFNEQQRRLDEASAQRIAAILEAARPTTVAIAGARRDGGPVAAGGRYLVGEAGPELIVPRRSGYVLTAQQTAAIMGGLPGRGRGLSVPSVGGQGEVVRKLDQVLKAIKARPPVRPQATYNLSTPQPTVDAVAMQLSTIRNLIMQGGL